MIRIKTKKCVATKNLRVLMRGHDSEEGIDTIIDAKTIMRMTKILEDMGHINVLECQVTSAQFHASFR